MACWFPRARVLPCGLPFPPNWRPAGCRGYSRSKPHNTRIKFRMSVNKPSDGSGLRKSITDAGRVLQTHGFSKNHFWINGPYESAFAAQPLAARGLVVLQVGHGAEPGGYM